MYISLASLIFEVRFLLFLGHTDNASWANLLEYEGILIESAMGSIKSSVIAYLEIEMDRDNFTHST